MQFGSSCPGRDVSGGGVQPFSAQAQDHEPQAPMYLPATKS